MLIPPIGKNPELVYIWNQRQISCDLSNKRFVKVPVTEGKNKKCMNVRSSVFLFFVRT